MFDDFFIRALVAGLGIALVTGPLGCFVIWRRLSFFAGTLAHSSLLGVTLAFSFDINISFSVLLISSAVALILLRLQKTTKLPSDALLGLLAHSSLAIGLVVIGFLSYIRFDIMGLLFGDIFQNYPQVDHIHYYGFYIGNFPSLEPQTIVQLCKILNSVY